MPKQPDYTQALAHLTSSDKKLAKLIEKVGPCLLRVRHDHSIFYTLMRSIVYQQLAGAAASAIMGRLDGLFGGYQATPEQILAMPDERLRGVGLSKNKMEAIRDLATKTMEGIVPTSRQMTRLSDEQIIERCVQVRGIGQWTTEMLLIFRLGRTDVLPVDDYGVRKGMQYTYKLSELPKKKEMIELGEKWRPYRSIASWYFWRACEFPETRQKKTDDKPKARKPEKKQAKSKAKRASKG